MWSKNGLLLFFVVVSYDFCSKSLLPYQGHHPLVHVAIDGSEGVGPQLVSCRFVLGVISWKATKKQKRHNKSNKSCMIFQILVVLIGFSEFKMKHWNLWCRIMSNFSEVCPVLGLLFRFFGFKIPAKQIILVHRKSVVSLIRVLSYHNHLFGFYQTIFLPKSSSLKDLKQHIST